MPLVMWTCCGGVVTVTSVASGLVGLRWMVGAGPLPMVADDGDGVTAGRVAGWGGQASEEVELGAGEETDLHPAEDVIHDGFGVADLLVAGPAGGLEAGVGELRGEDLQRDAVLEGERDGGGEGIHEAGDGGAFLGHAG